MDATRHLVSTLAKLSQPPHVFVSASAVGYYGNRGEEEFTEESSPGSDFLADMAHDWEAEAVRAAEFGARVVMLRFGVILTTLGGALPRILLPFRLGLGGRLATCESMAVPCPIRRLASSTPVSRIPLGCSAQVKCGPRVNPKPKPHSAATLIPCPQMPGLVSATGAQ